MRALAVFLVCSLAGAASAQQGGALDPESYAALSADDEAQASLGGFRRYLERVRADDAVLYHTLDPRLDDLESRELTADIVFWTLTGLSVAALVTAIPVYTELDSEEAMIGLVIGGVSTFLIGVIVQSIVRPGHGDLVALIDTHDEILGRR
jgi:predicted cobalt transporter CbtA